MIRRGRPADQNFSPAEPLYIRLNGDTPAKVAALEELLRLSGGVSASDAGDRNAAFQRAFESIQSPRWPRQSFNRCRYGPPTDVLFEAKASEWIGGLTVAVARLRDFAQPAQGQTPKRVWHVDVEHCPEPANFGHCEMRVTRCVEGQEPYVLRNDEGRDVPRLLKSGWRSQIGRDFRMLYRPTVRSSQPIRLAWRTWFSHGPYACGEEGEASES